MRVGQQVALHYIITARTALLLSVATLPHGAASPLEKEYAHQQAAVVNAAYDVLKKPLRRAHYIVR